MQDEQLEHKSPPQPFFGTLQTSSRRTLRDIPPKHGCGNGLMEEDWVSGTSPGRSFSCNDPKCFRVMTGSKRNQQLFSVVQQNVVFEHCRGITIIEYIIDFSLVN